MFMFATEIINSLFCPGRRLKKVLRIINEGTGVATPMSGGWGVADEVKVACEGDQRIILAKSLTKTRIFTEVKNISGHDAVIRLER